MYSEKGDEGWDSSDENTLICHMSANLAIIIVNHIFFV